MTPTDPKPTEAELDDFWRELRAQMIPDYLPLEAVDRRMEVEADPLPEKTIGRIVDRVTKKAALSTPPPRPQPVPARELRRWRFSQAAAASTLTAVLLSAGLVYVLWPENRDPSGVLGTEGLRFDHATIILADPGEEIGRRRNANGRVFSQVKSAIEVLKEGSATGGELGEAADAYLLLLRLSLENPTDVDFHEGSVGDLTVLVERARDGGLDEAERARTLRTVGQEAIYGVSSMIEATANKTGDAKFDSHVRILLTKLQAYLDQ